MTTVGDWAVLGVIGEGTTHGFAVAAALAPSGDLGGIWSMTRPVVYQTIARIEARGWVGDAGSVASPSGPPRSLVELTAAGRDALDVWLERPVEHLREVRSLLLLKLALLQRSGRPIGGLVAAQRADLAPRLAALRAAREPTCRDARGVTVAWRLATHEALARFLDDLDDLDDRPAC